MLYQRTIWPDIENHLQKKEAIIITGPRRVGKTTTLGHLLGKIETTNTIADPTVTICKKLLISTIFLHFL